MAAPARASQAEKKAVPHPSSTASMPWTSPSTPSSRSGIPNRPHTTSGLAHMSSAAASVKRSFSTAHSARFSAISEGLPSATRRH